MRPASLQLFLAARPSRPRRGRPSHTPNRLRQRSTGPLSPGTQRRLERGRLPAVRRPSQRRPGLEGQQPIGQPRPAAPRALDQPLARGGASEALRVDAGEGADQAIETADLEGERPPPGGIFRPRRVDCPADPLHQHLLQQQRLGRHLAQADPVLAGEVVLPVPGPGAGGEAEHPGGELVPSREVVGQPVDTPGGADEREQVLREHRRAVRKDVRRSGQTSGLDPLDHPRRPQPLAPGKLLERQVAGTDVGEIRPRERRMRALGDEPGHADRLPTARPRWFGARRSVAATPEERATARSPPRPLRAQLAPPPPDPERRGAPFPRPANSSPRRSPPPASPPAPGPPPRLPPDGSPACTGTATGISPGAHALPAPSTPPRPHPPSRPPLPAAPPSPPPTPRTRVPSPRSPTER